MRKGHGSSKVPNVKLRPNLSKSKKATDENSIIDLTSPQSDEEEEEVKGPNKEKPFEGCIISCSGVEDKEGIFKLATALGAICTYPLREGTTHLVANEPGSMKYNVALARGIPIMTEDWVRDSHQQWLEGDNVDLEQSMSSYILPPFLGTSISITLINEVDKRVSISTGISDNGGYYIRDPTTSERRITHLVCGDEGEQSESAKLTWAREWNKKGGRGRGSTSAEAAAENVHIVWEEWYYDCIEFGGHLPEKDYYFSKPRPKRKTRPELPQLYFPSLAASSSTLPQDELVPSSSKQSTIGGNGDMITPSATRLQRVGSQRVLETILKGRDLKVEEGRITKASGAELATDSEEKGSEAKLSGMKQMAKRAASFVPDLAPGTESADTQGQHKRNGRRPLDEILEASSSTRNNTFKGKAIVLLGNADAPQVAGRIQAAGGLVLSRSEMKDADWVVVRFASGGPLLENLDVKTRGKVRTECWLERCLAISRICDTDEHPLFRPLIRSTTQPPTPLRTEEGKELLVMGSGLDMEEDTFMKRALAALGVKQADKFTKACTHLICPLKTGAKYEKALEWGVTVEGLEWVWQLVTSASVSTLGSNTGSKGGGEEQKIRDITNTPPDANIGDGHMNDLVLPATEVAKTETHSLTPSSSHGLGRKRKSSTESVSALISLHETNSFGSSGLLNGVNGAKTTPPLKKARTSLDLSSPQSPSRLAIGDHKSKSLSALDIETADVIPSSVTPSPQKPTRSDSRGPSTQVSNKLKHTISELLDSSKDSLQLDDGEAPPVPTDDANGAGGVLKRRQRPTRVRSRGALGQHLSERNSFDLPPPGLPQVPDDELGGEGDESMRVRYYDAAQEDEKGRLEKLLSGFEGKAKEKEKVQAVSVKSKERPKPKPKKWVPGF